MTTQWDRMRDSEVFMWQQLTSLAGEAARFGNPWPDPPTPLILIVILPDRVQAEYCLKLYFPLMIENRESLCLDTGAPRS